MKRNRRRTLVGAVAALTAIPLAYGSAGLIGGFIPANAGWREPGDGIRIYVEDNGIHTGIVVPVAAAGVRFDDLVRPEHFRDRRFAVHRWRNFGWGDRDFYLNTPTWWDVSPRLILRAAFGSDTTVMHVDAVPQPRPGAGIRTLVLRPDEYRRLAGFIRGSFAAQPAHRHGYGGWDVFYDAQGTYSAVQTCNAWTGEALRHAGVRMGSWTPFPNTVMRWLPNP